MTASRPARGRALRLAPAAIAAAFAGALLLPAVELASGTVYSGFELLQTGWRGATAGVHAWLANPLFGVAWLAGLAGRDRFAGVVAGLACVVALTSFAAGPIARSGGAPLPAFAYGSGYYLWVAALFGQLLTSWLNSLRR